MESQSRSPDGKRVDLHGKAIAVIDDDTAVCDSTRLLLEVYGMDVLTYESGSDFLRDSPNVACLVVDYQMPGMNGLELVSELRKRGLGLPAIVITATSDPTVERRAAALGIRQVLRKLLANRVLLDAVQEELAP
jgi:FixJ family two-component response regulator